MLCLYNIKWPECKTVRLSSKFSNKEPAGAGIRFNLTKPLTIVRYNVGLIIIYFNYDIVNTMTLTWVQSSWWPGIQSYSRISDVDTCNQDCLSKGAAGCRTDASGIAPSGYECVCQSGYAWNGTHCEGELMHGLEWDDRLITWVVQVQWLRGRNPLSSHSLT